LGYVSAVDSQGRTIWIADAHRGDGRRFVVFVKAFGTLSAQSLRTAVNRSPERAVLFYATDYPEAGRAVAKLITASGFSPVSVGGIDQSIRIEVGGDLSRVR